MAAKQLLPGYGSSYLSEAITGSVAVTTGIDTLDTSRCAQFAVQISSASRTRGTVQVQQTFDGTNWANLGSSTAIALGTILRFGSTAGPYGKIRFQVTDLDTGSVVITLTVVGFELQGVA